MPKEIITFKELSRWIYGPSPLEVHQQLSDYSQTSFPLPRIVLSADKGVGYTGDAIYLDTRISSFTIRKGMLTGIYKNVDQGLRGALAEEDMHYISHLAVPENMTRPQTLFTEAFEKRNSKLLLTSFNLRAQFEAIGKIGKRKVISQFSPSYNTMVEMKERKEEIKISSGRLLADLKIIVRGKISKQKIEYAMSVWPIRIFNYIGSISGVEVADFLLEEFQGRFPDLIRTRLEHDPRFDSIILNLLKQFEGADELYAKFGIHL